MLNVNYLNFAKNLYSQNISPKAQNPAKVSRGGFGSNLAPLACDTISFTSNRANLNKSLYEAFDNREACRQVSENAKRAESRLEKTLKDALKKYVFNEKTNHHGAIMNISTRVKSANSIREKVAGELEYAITENKSKIFNPQNPEEIKRTLGDIIGARITLRKSDSSETSKIIDSLIREVEAGRLRITKIENYEPENCEDSVKYFKRADLERLLDAANKNRKPGQSEVELAYTPKISGYMALHIDVDLSDDNLPTKYNGYTGEIQIVGRDVERLKEVEDFLYKLKQGKTIKGGHSAYSAFYNYWTKYAQSEEYPNLDEEILKYTARAYMYQRKKEPIHLKDYKDKRVRYQNNLPTIAQCSMQGKVPPQLDFNVLARIKKLSDELYDLTSEAN